MNELRATAVERRLYLGLLGVSWAMSRGLKQRLWGRLWPPMGSTGCSGPPSHAPVTFCFREPFIQGPVVSTLHTLRSELEAQSCERHSHGPLGAHHPGKDQGSSVEMGSQSDLE